MEKPSDQSTVLQELLDRLKAGDASARALLLERACDRLRRLVRRSLKGFPQVKRWEDTDDVLQGAMLRLSRALQSIAPGTLREFLALSSTQIRRELIDLKRHHYGPQGGGTHHHTPPRLAEGESPGPAGHDAGGHSHDPAHLADWTEFHQHVERLSVEDREVFDLLWYQDLTQEEAATVLGVSTKTVSRRWREARLRLGAMVPAARAR